MYDKLNEQQLQAVLHPYGPLLVLAGAGSGKTSTLTTRIAHLISEGTPPEAILAVTFTNKAADEMLARVAKMTGLDTHGMWVSTFHSACLRILRRYAQLVGLNNGFSILDDSEQLSLVKKVLKELQDQDTDPKEALESISRAKNELLDLDNPIYQAYQEKLRQSNSVDFDDLIKKTVELFQANPRVLEWFQKKFQHILVDEYQDTNYAQHMLIDFLAHKHRNIFVVGDPDQSIYGWRGARLENMFEFIKRYQPAVVKLERNYRSTETILSAANTLILNNEDRLEKELWTDQGGGAPVSLFEAGDDREEGSFVAGRIKRLVREGHKLKDFAVFYRTHAQSRPIEEALSRAQIPYVVVSGTGFFGHKEIKDLLAYLKCIVNPANVPALQRVLDAPKRGIGPKAFDQIFQHGMENQKFIVDALCLNVPGLGGKAKKAANELGQLFQEWREWQGTVPELIRDVVSRSGLGEHYEEEPERVQRLFELASSAEGATNLQEFVDRVSLISEADKHGDVDAVRLMSLHAAKGLEFPVVFLTGLEEGVFPRGRDRLEEERRLCYVGLTRAMERLFLTYSRSRLIYGTYQNNGVSRFVREIGGQLSEVAGF